MNNYLILFCLKMAEIKNLNFSNMQSNYQSRYFFLTLRSLSYKKFGKNKYECSLSFIFHLS